MWKIVGEIKFLLAIALWLVVAAVAWLVCPK